MRLLILGDPDGRLPGALANRFRAAGADVVAVATELDESAIRDALGQEARAGIDACVVDQDRKSHAVALLDELLPEHISLLTCCHASSAATVAATLEHPARVVGFALLTPGTTRATVECARTSQTDGAAAEAAAEVWQVAGLEPVWVRDSTGLVLPRMVACLVNEAVYALSEGTASAEDIDRGMELGTRHPRGPLVWAERIGLDHILATLDAMAADLCRERYRAAPLLRQLVEAGRTSFAEAPLLGTGRPDHATPLRGDLGPSRHNVQY